MQMLSKKSKYAIRALLVLAQRHDQAPGNGRAGNGQAVGLLFVLRRLDAAVECGQGSHYVAFLSG